MEFEFDFDESLPTEECPKYKKDEWINESKSIFRKILKSYESNWHDSDDEDEEGRVFDAEEFANEIEDLIFEKSDFLMLIECEIIPDLLLEMNVSCGETVQCGECKKIKS